jgi:hypothetical protein
VVTAKFRQASCAGPQTSSAVVSGRWNLFIISSFAHVAISCMVAASGCYQLTRYFVQEATGPIVPLSRSVTSNEPSRVKVRTLELSCTHLKHPGLLACTAVATCRCLLVCGTTVLSSARPDATWHKQTTGSVIHRSVGELRCTHAAAWPVLLRRVACLAATMMRGC